MGKRAGDISRKVSEVLKSGPLRSFDDFKSRIKLPDEVGNELSKYFYFGPKDERDAETVKQKLIKALLGKRLAKEVELSNGKILLAKYRRLSQADIENLYNTPEVDVVLVLKPDFDEFFIDPPQHTNADIEGKPNEEQILDHALRPREIELKEENKKTLLTHFIYHEVLLPDKRLVPAFTKMTSEQVELLFKGSDKKKDRRKKKVEKKPVLYKICSKVNKDWIISGHKEKGTVKEDIVKTLQGTFTVSPVIDPNTGEHIIDQFMLIPKEKAEVIIKSGLHEIEVIEKVDDALILNALADDPSTSHEDALIRIYSKLRQGTPPNLEKARQLFFEKFYDDQRYKLGSVGRFRLNRKFNSDISEDKQTLQQDDVANVIEYILMLRGRKIEGKQEAMVDDIDHLGNRRLKTIEELVSDELRKGFLKLKKSVVDKMNSDSPENLTPRTLINSKAITTAMNYFFARGELSQVVDQTNPLSQLTHERRLSALGPGGLNRKRAGFDVRDVHISHYGRICPIETPEGANIGLISSLGIFAYIDKYGFLTTPYRVVKNKVITGEIVNLRADQEIDMIIAPADVELDEHNRMVKEVVMARVGDEYQFVPAENIQYTDISPKQMVGVSAALIPFLEHDDTARALMGSNMQRQAVPLIQCEPPRVATGMERFIPKNSGMCQVSEQNGTVVYADALKVIIKDKDKIENSYMLEKYVGLNDRSCLAQKPIVKPGQKVKEGQVIADGPGTANGELAIGKNIFIAFLPWDGYNFEDAIIMSEKLVRDDVYTSIHIDEFEKEIRETKLGKEEFTHEIPNVSTRARRYLEPDTGLVMLGTKVGYDDILVGKISPKSKSELTAEEKLLHAIFGKAGDDVK
ncbi:MAG: hypothetical protein K8S87_08620, partial [Planctomycetes bacterium]|nr:hypothetical protein [Planctomycetota bacterium]